jgi:hypothetical protein
MNYRRNHKVPWRIVEGKAVLVSVNNSKVVVFNEVGTSVWSFLDKERTFDDIVDHIASEFEADKTAVAKDVEAFLGELKEKEVLEIG